MSYSGPPVEYCNYSPSIIIRWRYLLVVVDAGAVMGLGDGVSVLDLLILLCIITSVILFFFLPVPVPLLTLCVLTPTLHPGRLLLLYFLLF